MPSKYIFEFIEQFRNMELSFKKSVSKTVQNLDTFLINLLTYCFYNIKSVQKTDTFLNSLKNINNLFHFSKPKVFKKFTLSFELSAFSSFADVKPLQRESSYANRSSLFTRYSLLVTNKGFTLLELLLVVIVLGILAAVAIPQFTDMTKDAKEAALKSTLASLRSTIELYYQQHKFIYPGDKKYTDGTATTTAVEREDSFINQLTLYSKDDGRTSASLDRVNYPYGPYLKQGIPANPLAISPSGTEKGALVGTATTTITAEASPTKGWRTSCKTGQIIANNSLYETW